MTPRLPTGYEALEPYAEDWAGRTIADRGRLRGASSPAQRAAFHAACSPLIEGGLKQLDRKPLADLDDQERTLMDMFLTYAHVSLAIDVQSSDEDKHRPLREAMRITRASTQF